MLKYYALFALFVVIMTIIGLTIGFFDSKRKGKIDEFKPEVKSIFRFWKNILIGFLVVVSIVCILKWTIEFIGIGFIIFIIIFILIFM